MPRMEGIGDDAANETDAELAQEEAAMLLRTASNLNALKPQISDRAAFEALLRAVEESTSRNESVAQFQARLKALGQNVAKVAKVASKLIA